MIDKITDPAMMALFTKTKNVNDAAQNTKGESFGDLLKDKARESIDILRGGEVASAKAVTGDASLPEVVQAITASEITLQTVMAVRDRLVGAYQEIMRMPV